MTGEYDPMYLLSALTLRCLVEALTGKAADEVPQSFTSKGTLRHDTFHSPVLEVSDLP